MFASDRVHQPLNKEVIDVGSNIVVLKGKIDRAIDGEVVGLVSFVLRYSVTSRETMEEDWPALLEKCEEGFPVPDYPIKRPLFEEVTLAQQFDETYIENRWGFLIATMTAQEHAQKIRRLSDQFRCNLKDVPKYELLGGVVT